MVLTGAYQMLPEPGQYPSPFPKVPAVVPPIHPDAMLASLPDQDLGQMVSFVPLLLKISFETISCQS